MSVTNAWPVTFPIYTVATLPPLDASQEGALAYCSNAINPLSGVVEQSMVKWSDSVWQYHDLPIPVTSSKKIAFLAMCQLDYSLLKSLSYLALFSDFPTGALLSQFLSNVTGAGSSTNEFPSSLTNTLGIVDLNTGTTATGRAYLSALLQGFSPLNKLAYFSTVNRISNLSDATNRYSIRFGFGDNIVGTDSVDGCYFRYVDTLNGGNLQCVNRNNNAETSFNTPIPPSTGFGKFEVALNGDGTSSFFVNGGAVSINQGGAPNAIGREMGVISGIAKSVGIAPRSLYADYILAVFEATQGR